MILHLLFFIVFFLVFEPKISKKAIPLLNEKNSTQASLVIKYPQGYLSLLN